MICACSALTGSAMVVEAGRSPQGVDPSESVGAMAEHGTAVAGEWAPNVLSADLVETLT